MRDFQIWGVVCKLMEALLKFMHSGWDVNWSPPTLTLPTPNVQGRSPPVQVKEHFVIYVNGSILVGLHPAVFDIKLISNFIRIKIFISFWSLTERGIQLHCNKFSYRGILHFDRRQNRIMSDILKFFIDIQHPRDVTICSNQIPAILKVKTLHGNHHLFNNKVTFFHFNELCFQENSAQP